MYKYEIVNKVVEAKVVAILRKIDRDKVEGVVEALIAGGIKCAEITVDAKGAFDTIRDVADKYGDKLCIGAGTILDPVSCRMAIVSGAEYIITPTVNEEVIRIANIYGKPCFTGATTPTEILKAYEYGAEMVKVFPAGALGTAFFKDVMGPLAHVPLMATGGIDLNNIDDFKKVGVKFFGIGSSLTNKEAIKNGDFKKIEELAKKFVEAVNK